MMPEVCLVVIRDMRKSTTFKSGKLIDEMPENNFGQDANLLPGPQPRGGSAPEILLRSENS